MSVSWGRNTRYKFHAGGELRQSTPPAIPAVYAVTYKENPESKPKAHTVLYFGHAENLAEALPSVTEQLEQLWNKHAGNTAELYIFIYPMQGSSPRERQTVHGQLCAEYTPSANY